VRYGISFKHQFQQYAIAKIVNLPTIGMLLGYYYSKLACCWSINTANWHAAGVLLLQIGMLLEY
jgi:hypothetical protein